jgi:hypothetical protein
VFGTWVLSFVAAFQGGHLGTDRELHAFGNVAGFRRGLVRRDLMLAILALIAAALVMAALWIGLGVPVRSGPTRPTM